jgi:glycosyltransferase involved in cell wall biosynthesis
VASKTRVSVLIPCHSLNYLDDAIKSIAAQSMPLSEFEVILVADRVNISDAEAILRNSVSNYRIYESDKPGIVNALNLGLSKSNSRYVARMDEDDLMEPNRLTEQCRFLDLNSDCVAVGGQLKLINEEGQTFGVSRFPKKIVHKKDLLLRSPIAHPAAMFRRDKVFGLGGYREGLPEDWDLWARLWQHGGIANLDSYVLRYRIHENQLSRSKMYKHSTSRLTIGTSHYAREWGLCDHPAQYRETDDWLAETGRALSKETPEYGLFTRDVKRESEMILILSEGMSFINIIKLIRSEITHPQSLLSYLFRIAVNRYFFWKSL